MATITNDKSFQVVPLRGQKNNQTWKIQVKMALIRENTWEIVNGSEECPQQADRDAYKKNCNRQDRALATIVLTLDPELLYLVENIDHPIQLWNKSEKKFQTKSVASKFALRKKLINTKLQDGTSFQSHAKIFSETFSNLTAIGYTLDNDDKLFYLLCSLPEKFDMIVATIENSDK